MTAQLDQRVPLPSLCRRRVWLVLKPTFLLMALATAVGIVRWGKVPDWRSMFLTQDVVSRHDTDDASSTHSVSPEDERFQAALARTRRPAYVLADDLESSDNRTTSSQLDRQLPKHKDEVSPASSHDAQKSVEPPTARFVQLLNACPTDPLPFQLDALGRRIADECGEELEEMISTYMSPDLPNPHRTILAYAISQFPSDAASRLAPMLRSPDLSPQQQQLIYGVCYQVDSRATAFVPVLHDILDAQQQVSDGGFILRFIGKLDPSDRTLAVLRSAIASKSRATSEALFGVRHLGSKAETLVPLIVPYLNDDSLDYQAAHALCGIGTQYAMQYARPQLDEWLKKLDLPWPPSLAVLKVYPDLARSYERQIVTVLESCRLISQRTDAGEILFAINPARYRSQVYAALQATYLRLKYNERRDVRNFFGQMGYAPIHPLYPDGANRERSYLDAVTDIVTRAIAEDSGAINDLRSIDDFDHPYFYDLPFALAKPSRMDDVVSNALRKLAFFDQAPNDVRLEAMKVLARSQNDYSSDIDQVRKAITSINQQSPNLAKEAQSILNMFLQREGANE